MKEREYGNRYLTIEGKLTRFAGSWKDVPHEELVRGIRETIAEEREHFEARNGRNTFDPAQWINFMLTPRLQASPSEQERDLARVWDIVSAPYLKDRHFQWAVREQINVDSRLHGRFISLAPEAVKLLDALAEAIDIPHRHGQSRFDALKGAIRPEHDELPALVALPTQRRLLLHVGREPAKGITRWIIELLNMLSQDNRQ